MNDTAPSRRRIGGWKLLLLIVGALVVTSTGSLAWWYHSDADIEQVVAEARQAGIATTWDELALKVSSPERLAVWRSLCQLAPGGQKAADPFAPVSQIIRDRHAAKDPAAVAHLLSLVDQLGAEPLIQQSRYTLFDRTSDSESIEIATFLGERVALADDETLARECHRLLAFIQIIEVRDPGNVDDVESICSISLGAIVGRLPAITTLAPDLADDLVAASRRMSLQQRELFERLFILYVQFLRAPREVRSPNHWWEPAEERLKFRLLQTDILRLTVSWASVLAPQQPRSALVSRLRSMELDSSRLIPSSYRSELRDGNRFLAKIVASRLRQQLHAELMAAEIRHQPWPQDPFAAPGTTLHRFERDGRLVGAYSIGIDGTDDGGADDKDFYFPLYGPREAPEKSP